MNLKETTGLTIISSDAGIIFNDDEIEVEVINSYSVNDLMNVFKEETVEEEELEKVVYKEYKNMKQITDKAYWEEVELDLLFINPGKVGEEFYKTKGYYRTIADNGFHYPEILQVAEGYVEILLQRPGREEEEVKEVILFLCQKYDLIPIPPAYGVTIINPTNDKAIIARIRAKEAEELREPYEKTKGECYYRLIDNKWIYNENYSEIPIMKKKELVNRWKAMKRGTPIYETQVNYKETTRNLIIPDPKEFII